ncbi:MAG: peptidoglycan DD-metalloendopeptidase family protein [Planctomycetes bacterium]|nr:peptidoglycan DD-metalloendopeptidase family protein [Planctomycetota bacterium]
MISLIAFAAALAIPPGVDGGLSLEPVVKVVVAAKSRTGFRIATELIVRNETSEPIGLDRITLDFGGIVPSVAWQGAAVVERFVWIGGAGRPRDESSRWVRPKGSGLLFVDPDVSLPKLPTFLRVEVQGDGGESASLTLPLRAFEPSTAFRLPVHGDEWILKKESPTRIAGRRAVVDTPDGYRFPLRFALDLVRTNVAGATRDDDERKCSSFYAYGELVVAAAAGTVVAVLDGIPDNAPGDAKRESGLGNRVSIDHGAGVFSHVAHLQPGSIRVGVGDHVEAGDVLGLVGNSGDSAEPALTFFLTDGKEPDRSQGLPCVFSDVIARGPVESTLLAGQMPLANDRLIDERLPRVPALPFGIGPFRRLPNNPILRTQGTEFWPNAVSHAATLIVADQVVLACGLQELVAGSGMLSFASVSRSKDGVRFETEGEDGPRPSSESAGRGLGEPRLVKIGEEYVLTYLVDDEKTKRLAIATCASSDLRSFQRKSFALGSRAVDGPGVVVAQKIGGRYVMYFGAPEIRVATSTDLTTWDVREEPVLSPRAKRFDSARVSAGPPPILTDRGVLLVYDGVDAKGRTAMGQALFSRDDPAKLIGRSQLPFFEPTEAFERFGLVRDQTTARGLVRFGERWLLYYGASGNAIGVASTDR